MITRTITIRAHVDPSGLPTCSTGTRTHETCRFLLFSNFGQQPVCGYGEQVKLKRGKDGVGYIIPHDDCPLWQEVAE